jgi:hypothetical protein
MSKMPGKQAWEMKIFQAAIEVAKSVRKGASSQIWISSMTMFDALQKNACSDVKLTKLFDELQEYAQIYLLAKQQQKGCNGMAQLVALRDEFRDVIEAFFRYCREKEYLDHTLADDLDVLAVLVDQFRRETTR